jgi:hypothetical protein
MYNMVCKMNPAAGALLAHIDVEPKSIPRPRDVWVNAEMTEVTVFTRTGGGNREAYAIENHSMVAHPLYLRDSDWSLDPTYAEFVFQMPPEGAAAMRAEFAEVFGDDAKRIAMAMEVITMTAETKFTLALEALKKA